MVSAQKVANEFLQLARQENRALTNMQLQKLVFLAQGYSLAILNRPIYYHNTHAWQWGPVIPKLYKQLQKYGSGVVTADLNIPEDDAGMLEAEEHNIIHGVWRAYGNYSGSQLSAITHRPDSPWSKTWTSDRFGIIPNEEIAAYYTSKLATTR